MAKNKKQKNQAAKATPAAAPTPKPQRGTRTIPPVVRGDWKVLAEAMRKVGWTFEQGKRHVLAFAPDGATWTTLSGSGDPAAYRNNRAVFRRWCRERGIDPGV